MADIDVKITFSADGRVLVTAADQGKQAVTELGTAVESAGAQAREGFEVAARGSANLKAEMTEARHTAVELAAAVGGLAAVKGLAVNFITMADAQGQLEARMRRVSESADEQAAVMTRLEQIADSAYVSVNDLVEIYVRSIDPLRQLGGSTATALDLTEALSLSMVVSATAADRRATAIDALSKVMQTGIARTEQFESILTSAPRFVEALEVALGKTRAELYEMASAGELTAMQMAEVGSQLDLLRAEVEDMPTTVEDAALRWSNAFQLWAGGANDATGATNILVAAIDAASSNIEHVMMATIIGATAVLGILISQGANWAVGLAQQQLATHKASIALKEKTAAAVREAQASLAAARASVADAEAKHAQSMLTGGAAAASAQLTAAKRAEAVASAQAAAASDAAGAAVVNTTSKVSTLIGVITGGAIGWEIGSWARGFEAVRVAADWFVAAAMVAYETLSAGSKVGAEVVRAAWVGVFNFLREQLANFTGALANTYERMARVPSLRALGVGDLAEQLREVEARVRPTSSAWERLSGVIKTTGLELKDFAAFMLDAARSAEAGRAASEAQANAIEAFARTGVVSTASVDAALKKLTGSLAQQDGQMKEQIATYGKGRAAAVEYARGIELAKAATIADDTARQRYIDGVNAAFAPLIANAQALDTLTTSHRNRQKASEADAKAAADFLVKLREEAAAYGLSDEAKRRATAAGLALSDAQRAEANTLMDLIAGHQRLAATLRPAYAAVDNLAGGHADLDDQLARGRDALAGLSAAQIEYNAALRAQNALIAQAQELGPLTAEQQAEHEARLKKLGEQLEQTFDLDAQTESARELESILARFDNIGMGGLVRDIRLVEEALERGADAAGNAFSDEQIERMKAALAGLNQDLEARNIELMQQGVSSLQALAKEGTAAYTALGIAQDILAYKAAVTAIANQGGGDPYTAFARIAAMIGMMASIGLRVGGHANSIGGSAQQRQATQGTGTVLGDASAKSESIARAVEITASATQQLVGINRGMLHALQNMAAGLSGASTLLARGAGNLEFDALTVQHNAFNRIFSPSVMGLLGSAMESITTTILGARNKITDTGILIGGGLLSELLQGITVGAYQESQSRSWWFGSTRTSTDVQDLGDDVAVQFQLVLDSIADAVRAGAEALGLDMQAVNAAIAAFEIEEIRISTMDLSAEEAQAELEAVFSAIFDDLAAHVVPFVSQFQRVGEGLGETLVRVATSVQVTQEAVRQLGISLDETDPERLAQISVGLVDLMGGIEDFISGMSTFVSAFAPESHKFSVAQDALTRAFAQFGIEVPESRDAMWDLMQSLDATTASGREQIAMLLQLADVSDSYYTMLEDRASRMAAIDASIEDGAWQQYLDGLTDSQRAIEETTRYYDDWTAQLIASGATTEQLAAVEEQRAVAMGRVLAANAEAAAQEQARLEDAGQRYADFITGIWRETVQLSDYQAAMMDADSWRASAIATAHEHARAAGMAGASEQALALIELRASQLRAQALAQLREETQSLVDQLYGARGNDIGTAFTSGLESASNAAADYWESQRRSAETLQQYLDSMLLGDLSALTPAEQLAEAWSQLNDAVAGGDADAATRLADVYLRLLRGHEASGEDYNAGFWSVRELLQGMLDNIGPIPDAAPAGADGSGYITAAGAEQIAAQNRLDLAVQLAQHLDDLAGAVGQTVWELMDSMGVDLRQLTADLGISLQSITGETVLALVNMADLLGTDLLTLTGQLGVSLTDMGAGIRELATQTGVNLDALTVESVQALGGLANQLGIDLADIATSVGADLGSLADSQSLLNQALQGEIDKLPDDQARALQEYFDNIVAATSEADANEAIDTMAGYINSLDADIREELAPYFDKVFPAKALTDLDYLTSINRQTADMATAMTTANGLLARIADNAMAANSAAGIPSYAVGTGYVPRDGLAMIHQGETIIPAPFAAWMRENGLPVNSGGGDNTVIVAELRNMSARLDRIERATTAGAQQVAATVAKTGEISDRNADASRARHAQAQRRGVTA